MNDFQFTLASNKVPKLNCPHCGAKKHWQCYIDTRTGDVLPAKYGRCDNENKCGEWHSPYDDGYDKSEDGCYGGNSIPIQRSLHKTNFKPVFIPKKELIKTLNAEDYDHNVFVQNLLTNVPFPFDIKDVERVVSQYYLGTTTQGYMSGAITFPFIDQHGNIRAVQVKKFNENNSTTATSFLHSLIMGRHLDGNKPLPGWLTKYNEQDLKVSCLFGEHLLLKYPTNPVALVEAPKTAIYGTLYFGFPDQTADPLWLAVFNKSSFTFDRLKALQGRVVLVFPDLSNNGKTYEEWYGKAREFEKRLTGIRFVFSDLLERHALEEDKIEGCDLADYLIRHDWRQFRKEFSKSNEEKEPQHDIKPHEDEVCEKSEKCEPPKTNYLFDHLHEKTTVEDWSGEIEELRQFFAQCSLPLEPVKLDQCTTIINLQKFIKASLSTLETYNGVETGKPVLQRLRKLKELLSTNSN